MISGQLSAEISATCSALGDGDGLTYRLDPYCKESIKDLIRFLRRDSEDHAVRRFLGSTKVLKTDLVPILIHHSDNDEIFDVVLRLIMNLTTPALIVFQEQIPSDKSERNLYLQLISQLQEGKEIFTDPEVWNVLVKNIGKLLETESYERDEDTSRTLERILILARNVLAVPSDTENERRADNDVNVHDKVLWAMHNAKMDEIFLYIASSEKEQQVYMHILEIVSLMLREQNPSTLAKSQVQRSFSEKEKDEQELLAFREAEIKIKQMKVKKYAGTRHFGGTYVMKGVKAAGDRDLIFHKPLDKAVNMEFDFGKKRIKWPKNLQPLKQVSEERKSTFGVRLFLKEFCVDLLNGAYNPLMRRVKDIIERGKSNGDESYYFWAMKFFMEFNRSYNFQVKLVSETLSIETFHFIQTQLENWNDMMLTEKKKIPLWSRRMHLALKAYQELLLTLSEMDRSPDEAVRGSSQVLKSRVFYVTEYRDLLAILIHVFKKNRFSHMYMKDLIETLHIFMKMLQKCSEKHRGGLVVQQKKRVAKKTGKKNSKSKSGAQQAVNMEAIWDEVGPQLSAVLQSDAPIPTDVVPFDAASDVPIDEQKVDAMKRIQSLLKSASFEEAIGLLRAAREVWPENNCFGAADLQPEDEFMAVRDIFMADLGQPGGVTLPGENAANDEDEDEEDEEEYGDAPTVGYQESELNFEDFVRRFISEKTLQICGILLEKFESNSAHTNHCIVKLLHRIAVDCRMPAMLFQASLFRIFQRAMASPNPEHKEFRRFARFMVQKFLETAEKNPKVFIELLFWKKVKDAVEITEGYGSTSTKSHSVKNLWSEEQEDELTRLYQEFMSTNPPESNPVDWIMENLINRERSRVSVIKKLKELHLWSRESVAELKRSAREWSQEEEDQLRELVPEFLNAENPMECIMSRLIGNRSKSNVIRKILDLGLVDDRKQLRKKRSRKSREKGKDGSDESNSSSDGLSDDEAADKESSPPVVTFEKVVEALNSAIFDGFKEPLEWLVSSMNEMLEDLEADQEDVPLLPLTDVCTQAMENPLFTSTIQVLGIKRPDEQEVFWRLPGIWTEARIKDMIRIIEEAIEGNLSTASDPGSFKAEKVEQKKPKEKPKKKTKKPDKKTFNDILNDLDRSGDDSNTDLDNSRNNVTNHSDSGSDSRKGSGRKSRRNSGSSSDSSNKSQQNSAKKSRGLRLWLDSDSDSDSAKDKGKTNGNKSDSDGSKRKSSQVQSRRSSGSEPESSNSKRKETRKRAESRRKVLESDSDSEDSRVKTNGKSSGIFRESDSDSGESSKVKDKKKKESSKLWRSSDSESSVTNTQASEKIGRHNGVSRSDDKKGKVSDSDSNRGSRRSSQKSSRFGSQRKNRGSSSGTDSDSNKGSPKSRKSSQMTTQQSSRSGSPNRNRHSSSDSDSNRGSPKSQKSSPMSSRKSSQIITQQSSRFGGPNRSRRSSSGSDSNRGSPRSQKSSQTNTQQSSRSGSPNRNRHSSSGSDSNRGSPRSQKSSQNSRKSSQTATQQSSRFGSPNRNRHSSSDSDSNRGSQRSQKSSQTNTQQSSRSGSPNRNRHSSSDSDSNRRSPRSQKSSQNSRKSSQTATQQSSRFGSPNRNRHSSSDSDSNRGSQRSQKSSQISSQMSSIVGSQRNNRDISPETSMKNGKNKPRKRSDSLSSMEDGTQSSILNSSQLKRKRGLKSSSDDSDNKGSVVSQRKKTTKKSAIASSNSKGEEGDKDKSHVMIVDDDDVESVSKNAVSENGVESVKNKPKRKRIVIGSDSDD